LHLISIAYFPFAGVKGGSALIQMMSSLILAGKTALVTGSTSGIGLGIANRLAYQGANIILNGFADQYEIEAISKNITDKYKVKVQYQAADLTNPSDIELMMSKSLKWLGRLDILVNNAGIQHVSPIAQFDSNKFEQIIKLNLNATFYTTKFVLPSMLAADWGRIINIASVHGLVASVEKSAYVAAKHGVIGNTLTSFSGDF
jgi:3-hydroxybutyrate dehydrogenase